MRFYERAAVPPEAPEKRDHGDIDVLVDGPLFKFTTQDLAKELSAVDYLGTRRASSFAIQISEDSDSFFQLDVQHPKQGCFEWESVIHSYGDIWRIIGSTVTHFGLAIKDSGLHARIEETEVTQKKASLLLLTCDPQDMMSFLSLNSLRYKKGFSTLGELFEWATAMPLFCTRFFEKRTASEKQGRVGEKRSMYSKFVTEWLPQQPTLHTSKAPSGRANQKNCEIEVPTLAGSCTSETEHCQVDESAEEGSSGNSRIDERRALLDKALLRFNKREEYLRMLEAYRKRTLKDAVWEKIASTLPLQGKDLGQAIVALKRCLRWDDGRPRLKVETKSPMRKVPVLDAETVDMVLLPWIREHWREAVKLYDGSAR